MPSRPEPSPPHHHRKSSTRHPRHLHLQADRWGHALHRFRPRGEGLGGAGRAGLRHRHRNDADLFLIHDNGFVDQRLTRTYDSDGNLTSRVIHEKWGDTFWSNPLSGKTVPYTQTDKITTVLTVPGDFGSAVETTVGSNIYTDPATHQKVLTSAGRVVFGADGSLESRAGQQPFIDAFVDGDMSVFDPICAALS